MRQILTTLLEIAGAALVVVGIALVHRPTALVVAGLAMIGVAYIEAGR